MSREDYERIIFIAREIHKGVSGKRQREYAKELFTMVENVIGQQSPLNWEE